MLFALGAVFRALQCFSRSVCSQLVLDVFSCPMAYAVGDSVIYQSESRGPVIGHVIGGPHADGTYDLDCKARVPTSRLVLHRGDSEGSRSTPGFGQTELREGDVCFYNSASKGWIAAQVLRRRANGDYDLDCKEQVQIKSLFVIEAGSRVEYHSASQNRWIPAKVVKKGMRYQMF